MVLDGGNRDYKSLSWRLCVCVWCSRNLESFSFAIFIHPMRCCSVIPWSRVPTISLCVCVYKMVEVTFVFSSENYVKVRLIVYAVTKMMWRGGGFWDIKSERK